jgi:octanoyl-[GcvH]:protein N-octanoyltransferase
VKEGVVLVAEKGLRTDPEFHVALGPVLLRRGLNEARDILRIHIPEPTAAFSRRDTLRPRFSEAARAARELGFTPVVRPQGGRVAAYHEGSVVIDHVVRVPNAQVGLAARFERYASLHASALASVGVSTHIGEVPGEYCPGEFSLNVGGTHKVAGSAQRVTKNGWLLSTVIQVAGSVRTRTLLTLVYAELGYDFDPATVGALEDFSPVSVRSVRDAVIEAYTTESIRSEVRVPPAVVQEAADAAAALHIDPWPDSPRRDGRADPKKSR